MEFPKNEDIQRPWVKAVESTRKFLKGPSKHTVICSDHINADCFVQTYRIKPSFNLLAIKKVLDAGAVPTIFQRPVPKMTENIYKKEYQTSENNRKALEIKSKKQNIPANSALDI